MPLVRIILPSYIPFLPLTRVGSSRRLPRLGFLFATPAIFVALIGGISSLAAAQTAQFTGAQSAIPTSTLSYPGKVAVDRSGSIYISDTFNGRVLKETPTQGTYTESTVVSGLGQLGGIALDGNGDIFITEFNSGVVVKETLSGNSYTQSTVAVELNYPSGVAVDANGDVFIVDSNPAQVYKETPSGGSYVQSTVSTASSLSFPAGIAIDANGNLYIADWGNWRVLKETLSNGSYTESIIGSGLEYPNAVSLDASGNVYISDSGNNRIVKETYSNGSYSQSVVPTGTLYSPAGAVPDASGNLYITNNPNILLLSPTGGNFGPVNVASPGSAMTLIFEFTSAGTIAEPSVVTQGISGLDFTDAGTGSCTTNGSSYEYSAGATCTVNVSFSPKYAGVREGAGILLNDSGNAIATGYVVGTGIGPRVSYSPNVTRLSLPNVTNPYAVAVDAAGNLYIAQAILAYDPSNALIKETWNGGGYTASTIVSGMGYPTSVAVDGAGNVYVGDQDNYTVYKETPTATGGYQQSVVDATLGTVGGLAVDGFGNVYIGRGGIGIEKETLTNGSYVRSDVFPDAWEAGFAVDSLGSVYLAIEGQGTFKETPTASGYVQVAINVALPQAVDGFGNLYYSDNAIIEERLSGDNSYTQTTLATGVGGLRLAVDGAGNVYASNDAGGYVAEVNVGQAPVVHFAATAIGHTSSDSPQTVQIENTGNAAMNVPVPAQGSNPSIPSGFTVNDNGGSACPLVDANSGSAGTLAAGASCDLTISFSPQLLTDTSGWLTYTYDGPNETSLNYQTSAIPLIAGGAQLAPAITWANPRGIVYGTALGAQQLNATANVPGTFSYSPAAGTVLTAGQHTLSVTFTPTDSTDFTTATGQVTINVSQATPPINWTTPSAITYGTALSAMQLNASSPVAGTFSYSPSAGVVLTAGSQTLGVTFTPTDTADYATASAQVTLTVSQAMPTITWATPTAITYGTALSSTQLDATASVPGTFSYSSPVGTVLTAGSHAITATFTPTDTTDYKSNTATVYLTVNQATPTITWTTPAAITYGTALGGTQLNATASVPGTFQYSSPSGSILTAGSHIVTASFYPNDWTDYAYTTATVTLVVNKATPTITWTAPTAISYGTALSSTQLNARATGSGAYTSTTVSGSFVYSPASGTVLSVGSQNLSTTFTPTDTTDYATATASVTLTINQATPTITWAAPAAITYGTALNATQLNAVSTVAGSFSYSPAAGIVLGAGPQALKATFTPTDTTDYSSATASVMLTVNPAAPTITWATPSAVAYGTALSATQLDATASVPGTFAYSPALGSIPAAGNDRLSTTFTPTDAVDYTTATASVILTVSPNPAPFLGNMTPAIADAGGSAFTITVNGANFLPSSTVYWGTSALATQYVSASQLTATVTSADIATPGATAVNVQTPAPGGGTSDVLQFEVDSSSGSASAPSAPSTVVSVTAGSTATYTISFPADVTSAAATCLNLPAGALCSFSNATNVLTITTSSTTPTGTYQVTVVFSETVTSATSAWIMAPLLLLPLFLLRKKLQSRGILSAACLGLVLLGAAAYLTGCGGSSSSNATPTTHSVTSSAVVGLAIR